MAFKTRGSGALKPEREVEVKVKVVKNVEVTSGDSDASAKPASSSAKPNFQVIKGGRPSTNKSDKSAESTDSAARPNFQVVNGGAPAKNDGASGELNVRNPELARRPSMSRDTGVSGGEDFSDVDEPKEEFDEDVADDAEESENIADDGEQSEDTDNAEEAADDDDKTEESENQDEAEQPEGENSEDEGDGALAAAVGTSMASGAGAAAMEAANELGEPGDNTEGEGANAGDAPRGDAERAAASLRNGENAAAKNIPGAQPKNTNDANKDEKNPNDSGIKNSTIGKGIKDLDPRAKMVDRLKKDGPIGMIILIVIFVGALITGSQSLMLFSIANSLTANYETTGTSAETRYRKRFFIKALAKDKVTTPRSSAEANYEVTANQRNKLAKNGIYVVNDGDKSVALYNDGSDKLKIVAASDLEAESYKSRNLNFSSIENQLPANYNGPRDIETSSATSYSNKIRTDTDFDTSFAKGTRTFASAVANWFDRRTEQFSNLYNVVRNLFKKWRNDDDADADNATKLRNVGNKINGVVSDDDSDSIRTRPSLDEDGDADSNDPNKYKYGRGENDSVGFGEAPSQKYPTAAAATEQAKKVANKITPNEKVQAATTFGCLALYTVGSVSLLMSARQIMQLLPTVSAFLETVDKVKSGNSNAPFNTLAIAIAIPAVASIITSRSTGGSDYEYEEQRLTEKSAIQSNAMISLLAGTKMDPNDSMIASFNTTKVGRGMSNFLAQFGISFAEYGTFMTCSIAKAAINALSVLAAAGIAIAGIVACVGTGGIGCIVESVVGGASGGLFFKAAAKKVAKVEAQAFIMTLLNQYVVPAVATLLVRDIASDLFGEQLGTALAAGAGVYLSRNHLFGGGSPATRKTYTAFAVAQQETIARNAAVERSTRSPFDYTSDYTFAGSLLKQITTLSASMSSPLKTFSAIGSLTKKSIISLMPSAVAAADNINETMMTDQEIEDNCPALASIGAVGDAFCNPLIVSDMGTMDMDPEDVASRVKSNGGLDSSGNIDESSELAKYIVYCGSRSSNFGVIDYNIANSVGDSNLLHLQNGVVDTAANTLVGMTPILGDILDVFSEEKKVRNISYITGEKCVASENESDWQDETRYYQRYVEDERLRESLSGGSYTSPVTSFIDKYYTENPIDNSYEGTLARLSGLTKDQVVATLDVVEYLKMVADYKPSERYYFDDSFAKPREVHFDDVNQNIAEAYTLPSYKFVYEDSKYRLATIA